MTYNDDTRSNLDPRKDDGNVAGNLVGEGVGGASGIYAGAALGSLGGPVGTVIGALAGAVGGWWAGRAVSEGIANYSDADDAHYRTHHTSAVPADAVARSYEDARPAYQLGHVAGSNPDYAGRSFEQVESDLQRGWTSDVAAKHGDWSTVRPYARTALPGEIRRASIVSRPQISSSVPAAGSQLNLYVTAVGVSPLALRMFSPGQSNSVVPLAMKSLIGPSWARPKTRMMIR